MSDSSSSSRVVAVQQELTGRLWPLPLLMVIIAAVTGYMLPLLDAALADVLPERVQSLLFSGGPDAARAVLSQVAGSIVTVTSLTFSLTVVTLQLASSQFTPRLLRTFISDVFTQATLGLFLGTFSFGLMVLRTVRSPEEGDAFVPRIAVTLAVLLAVGSAIQLVLFIGHLVRQIRAETILARVKDDALETIARRLTTLEDAEEPTRPPVPPAGARPLVSPGGAVLTGVSTEELLEAAVRRGAVLRMDRAPGEPAVPGAPIALAWPVDPAQECDLDGLEEDLAEALTLGPERTSEQDVAFGLRQLVDIAARALSPGVNDPTTAVHAINQISAVMCALCERALHPPVLRDDDGRIRVVTRARSFSELLELACGQVRRYGASETDVVSRLLQLLREVAWCARTEQQRDAVVHELDRLQAAWPDQISDAADTRELHRQAGLVREALGGRWSLSEDGPARLLGPGSRSL